MNRNPNDLLVWLDLETTGLDPDRCAIIQMGIIITDNDLNEVDAAEWTIIPPGPAHWIEWEDGAQEMHKATGLYEKVMARTNRPLDQQGAVFSADGAVLYADAMLNHHFPADFRPMLAGNSVHFDRAFLTHSSGGAFAELARRFFHRHYDASAVLEFAKRTLGLPLRYSRPKDEPRPHTALADLRETLADLRILRDDMRRTVFVPPVKAPQPT